MSRSGTRRMDTDRCLGVEQPEGTQQLYAKVYEIAEKLGNLGV